MWVTASTKGFNREAPARGNARRGETWFLSEHFFRRLREEAQKPETVQTDGALSLKETI